MIGREVVHNMSNELGAAGPLCPVNPERGGVWAWLHLAPKVTKVTERSERRASERVPGTFRTVAPREVSAILRVMSPLSKPLVRRLARRAAPPCARRACVA